MNSSVCTLFEGDYHYGLAALINSLCSNGFNGEIYAGYRGDLPEWSLKLGCQNFDSANLKLNAWSRVEVTETVHLVLVPVSFEGHLTNRKPDFMLQLFEESPFKMDSLFYMDPDLLVNAPWKFFTDWLSCGVAVCEDVNSPLPVSSPQRIGWRREFAKFGILLQPKDSCYANGGFIGVSCENKDFLISWKQIQDCLWKIVGGADFSGFMGGQELECRSGLCNCFIRTDQDALNATLEASKNIPISFLGRQAMGFCSGDAILPHAIGSLKPWRRNIIIDALRGVPPRLVDKCFWGNVTTPIQLFHSHKCARKRIEILVASLIGRFYSKR